MMNTAKSFFAQNKTLTAVTFIIWLASCICGIYCAATLDGDGFANVSEYVVGVIDNGATVWQIIRLGISENFKFLICILAASSLVFLLPLTVALVAFKGFAAGFTASLLIKIYSFKGVFISFGTVVIPFTLSLPMHMMMFVAAIRFPLQKRSRNYAINAHEKRQMWLSYASMQLVLMILICMVTVLEALISQIIFHII